MCDPGVDGCKSQVTEQGSVRVRRSLAPAENGSDPIVRFAVDSDRDHPMAVRIADPGLTAESIDVETDVPDENDCRWVVEKDRVLFSRSIPPKGSFVAECRISDPDRADTSGTSPTVETVQPVDPETIKQDRTAPLWRSATTSSGTRTNGHGAAATAAVAGAPETEEARARSTSATAAEESTSLLLPANSDATPVLSVVMPTLNEEEGVEECIDAVISAVEDLGITAEVIISDSSTDHTPEIAREMGAIVVEPDDAGYGYAYRYAFGHARGKYVAIGDADTTYDFEDLPRLLAPITRGEADMVMGTRLAGEIESGAMPPLHQYIGNPLLTKFLNVFYGAGVSDAHSGFRVIDRDVLNSLDLSSDGMEFASEMIMVAGARNVGITEVPITYHEREGEATLDSFEDGWRHVKFMLVNAPGYVYSAPGLVLGVLGVVMMGLVVAGAGVSGVSLGVHSLMTGSLLSVVGHQLVGLGAFATAAGSPVSRPEDPITTWITDRSSTERGILSGVALITAGGSYAVYAIGQWTASGLTDLPLVFGDVVALTAIVLGVQTVFYSLFMATIDPRW